MIAPLRPAHTAVVRRGFASAAFLASLACAAAISAVKSNGGASQCLGSAADAAADAIGGRTDTTAALPAALGALIIGYACGLPHASVLRADLASARDPMPDSEQSLTGHTYASVADTAHTAWCWLRDTYVMTFAKAVHFRGATPMEWRHTSDVAAANMECFDMLHRLTRMESCVRDGQLAETAPAAGSVRVNSRPPPSSVRVFRYFVGACDAFVSASTLPQLQVVMNDVDGDGTAGDKPLAPERQCAWLDADALADAARIVVKRHSNERRCALLRAYTTCWHEYVAFVAHISKALFFCDTHAPGQYRKVKAASGDVWITHTRFVTLRFRATLLRLQQDQNEQLNQQQPAAAAAPQPAGDGNARRALLDAADSVWRDMHARCELEAEREAQTRAERMDEATKDRIMLCNGEGVCRCI